MTRFALCWNRDGAAVPPEVRRAIGDGVARRAAAAPQVRVGPEWAAWCSPSGWAGDAENALPLELGGWVGAGALRLDDRGALTARLRDRGMVGPTDDATLALHSFIVWGQEAPRHWMGDYAIAALAPDRGSITLSRGVLGVLHLFHARAGPVTIVADDPALIGEVAAVDGALDERAVVEYLATGELVTPGISFRRGVQRVPAAHTVVITRDGRISRVRHWDLPVPDRRVDQSPVRILEEFGALIERAVGDRLRSTRAGLLLSGGVDSALLATAIAPSLGRVDVSALTVSWKRLLPGDDEPTWATRAATLAGIPQEIVEMGAADGIDDASLPAYQTPEPAPDPEPLVSRAVAARLDALAPVALMGEDPDTLLFPPTLRDQLRRDGLRGTFRAWRDHLATGGARPWIGARRSIAMLERWRDRRERRPPAWLRDDPRARDAPPETRSVSPHPTRPLAARALRQPVWENSLWNDAPQMSGAAVQVLLPFMDPRIIAFVWSLPPVPWMQRKHLIREALRARGAGAIAARPKTPLRGYYDARLRGWRHAKPLPEMHPALERWVDLVRWRHALVAEQSADRFFEALRVRELSRWLAQPRGTVR